MNFIVTGSAGFIGSSIVEHLIAAGHTVISFDNFDGGILRNVYSHKKHIFRYADLRDIGFLRGAMKDCPKIDGVFHCAAQARIQPSLINPVKTMETNCTGTLNILSLMKDHSAPCMVYCSSSSIYGKINKLPFKEEMPVNCLTPYSVSKYTGELLCECYANLYGLKIASLRFFNVYGHRSPVHLGKFSPVINLFFQQALKGKPITLVDSGEQSRDFTYVDDVAEASLKAMNYLLAQKKPEHTVINIGTGISTTLSDLADKIVALVPGSNKISNLKRTAEALHVRADITKAKNLLDWQARYTLDDTLPKIKEQLIARICT